jgi:DNA-binding MarR family transcriptional regulator
MSVAARADQPTILIHDARDAYLAFAQALLAVAQADNPAIGALAAILRVSRPEASRVADQLYRRGLITRVEDSADRRRSLLGLTGGGTDLVGALLVGDRAVLARALARLEPDDLQQLLQGLHAALALARTTLPTPGLPAPAPVLRVPGR